MKSKVLVSSILTIALCLSLIAGSTFALFTSQSEVNVAVTSGKVNVIANINDLELYSVVSNPTDGTIVDEYGFKYDQPKQNDKFYNGGTATIAGNVLTLDRVTPGDKVTFNIKIDNNSDVATQYRTLVYCTENDGLLSGLEIGLNGNTFNGFAYTAWAPLAAGSDIADVAVSVELPVNKGNEYQETKASLCFIVEAVQGNGGTAYGYLPDLDADGAYEIANAADLFIFASKVNDGTFANAKAELTADIDLAGKVWLPIDGENVTFDGAGYTISNLYTLEKDAAGLFGYGSESTISNVTLNNATVISNHYAAGIVAHALCTTVDNCTVKNSTITTSAEFKNNAWDNGDKAGAIAGYLSAENTASVTNCTVENVTVKGYRDIGGVVGYANAAATITGNTVSDSTIVSDRTHNYKNYISDEQYHVNAIVGEGSADASNTATNVEIVVPARVPTEEALQDAITAGGTIVLDGDVHLDDKPLTVPAGTSVTIDLNGNTISGWSTSSTTDALIKVAKGAELILTGDGIVAFEAANPDVDWNPEGFPTYANNAIRCEGKLVIDGVTIKNTTNPGGASYAIDCYPGADLVINSGVIDGCGKTAIRMFCNSNTESTNVTINGGTITGSRAIWIQLPSSKITNERLANLTINGGDLISTTNATCIYSYSYGDSFAKTNVTINGGNFVGDVLFGGGSAKSTQENVTITGGTFSGWLGRYVIDDGINGGWEDIVKP